MKYYVIFRGSETGIFDSWDECKKRVNGYKGAVYKSYKTKEEAERAFAEAPTDASEVYKRSREAKKADAGSEASDRFRFFESGEIMSNALAVDAACSGVPGKMEYRGVWAATGEEVFHSRIYEHATNNIGEFLAIVHGLAWLKQKGISAPIYSDSRTAISWIRDKRCKTTLERVPANTPAFERVAAAERWLAENDYAYDLHKWDTGRWGEIPADFGRKKR